MKNISKYSIYNENLFDNIKEYLEKYENKIILDNVKIITKNKRKRVLVYMECSCGNKFKKTFDAIMKKSEKVLCPDCSKKQRAKRKKRF